MYLTQFRSFCSHLLLKCIHKTKKKKKTRKIIQLLKSEIIYLKVQIKIHYYAFWCSLYLRWMVFVLQRRIIYLNIFFIFIFINLPKWFFFSSVKWLFKHYTNSDFEWFIIAPTKIYENCFSSVYTLKRKYGRHNINIQQYLSLTQEKLFFLKPEIKLKETK